METKFMRKLNDLETALINFRDTLALEPALFPDLVTDNIKSGQIQKFDFTVELLLCGDSGIFGCNAYML